MKDKLLSAIEGTRGASLFMIKVFALAVAFDYFLFQKACSDATYVIAWLAAVNIILSILKAALKPKPISEALHG